MSEYLILPITVAVWLAGWHGTRAQVSLPGRWRFLAKLPSSDGLW
jgi:hypothetical protein